MCPNIQWNLVNKEVGYNKILLDNKVILLVPALYISLWFFHPDITRNMIYQGNFDGPKVFVIKRFHSNLHVYMINFDAMDFSQYRSPEGLRFF